MAGGSGIRIGSEGSGDDFGGGGARLQRLARLLATGPSRAEQIAAASGDPAKLDALLTPGFAPVQVRRTPSDGGMLARLVRLLRGQS